MQLCQHKSHDAQRRRRSSGFTLIEVVIVVTILALLAGAVAMRFTGQDRREAVVAADDVADLLALFAHKHAMGQENIAIGYDPNAGVIMMLELLGDPSNPNDPTRWEMGREHLQVRLPESISVIAAEQDGVDIAQFMDDWFIPAVPGGGRPDIELVLYSASIDETCSIYLPGFEVDPVVVGFGQGEQGVSRVPVDLDAEGRSKERW